MNCPDGVIFSISSLKLNREEISFFKETNPLGFVLFKRNFKNISQLSELIKELKSITLNENLLIFVDQEGGRVQRFNNDEFTKFPSQNIFGKLFKENIKKAKRLSYLTSYLIGWELKRVGIDVNFSPVCDLLFADAHKVIGDRSFDENPKTVNQLVKEYCKGLRDSGIFPVLKHYPGHGRSEIDTHENVSIINTDLATLKKTDLIPFTSLNKESLVMLAHIFFNKIDSEVATYSRKINFLLRNYHKFNGLIITDDIGMKGLQDNLNQIVLKSYNAGCDVILHCNGKIEEMKKIYPLILPIKKKYYESFYNDIMKIKQKDIDVRNIKEELLREKIIDQ